LCMFLDLARRTSEPATRFRFLMAGVYSARAIVELMLDAAEEGLLCVNRDQLKDVLARELPWYNLIEKIRIHDFHRFGLTAPDPKMKGVFYGGRLKIVARKGKAIYTVGLRGPQKEVTGASEINEQRPLLRSNGTFFDDESRRYVSLEEILTDFAEAVPSVVAQFEKDMG